MWTQDAPLASLGCGHVHGHYLGQRERERRNRRGGDTEEEEETQKRRDLDTFAQGVNNSPLCSAVISC